MADKFNPDKNTKLNRLDIKIYQERLAIQKEINDALGYESGLIRASSKLELDRLNVSRQINDLEELLNIQLKKQLNARGSSIKKTKDNVEATKKLLTELKKSEKSLDKQLQLLKKQEETYKKIGDFANQQLVSVWRYLMDSDKAIKGLNLELGLSGGHADVMRKNIEGAATNAQRLGVSIAELAKIQSEYSNETQKTTALTSKQLENITNIGKGTALGVEQAGQLVGQFNLLGISVQETEKFVQGVVDSSERLGINATKVLKTIGKNFKVLNTFTFKDGVKGMAKIAEYAEMYKADINDSINSAKMARSLDGAIEMASQLNVLGGEFAKQDPFELLFLSRNDPAAYTKKLAEMTKGMATLNKTSDGKFQLGFSPQDQDRMRLAAEALGTTYENMAESALRVKKMQMAKQDILGLGSIDEKDKEMIASLSDLGENGKMQVMLKGHAKEVSKLTSNDIELLKQQQVTLKQRAIESQTFEDVLKNTILEMRSALLPVLESINTVLGWVNDFKTEFPNLTKSLGITAGVLLGAFTIFKAGSLILAGVKGIGALFGGGGAGAAGGALGGGGLAASAGGIAALGVAALGAGAGIGLAAVGISKLAESIKELTGTQILGLAAVVTAIGAAMYFMIPALAGVSATATAGALGLGAIALAAAGIGVALWGVGEAAIGIGTGFKMAAEGVGSLFDKFASVPVTQLFGIAGGIYAIGGAMAALGAGGIVSLIGGGGALAMLLAISSQSSNLVKVGDAFKQIGVVMNGSADQFERVEKAISNIANVKMGSDNFISQLAEMLSKPLKVEFADKKMAISTDITLQIDGQKLAKVTNVGREAIIQAMRQKQGTGSSKTL